MRKNGGFTLLELLIAAAIFAVVIVSVYFSFTSGLFGYRNIDEAVEAHQAARLAFETIDRDLRNAFFYKEAESAKESKFLGFAKGVSFLTLVNSYREKEPQGEFAFVSYEADSGKLMRLCRRNKESLNEESQIKPEELIANVQDLSIEYLSDLGQPAKQSWDDPEALPVALKIDLKLQYKYRGTYAFSRTIFLPLAYPVKKNE